MKSKNNSNEYIADKLDVCISVVRLCIDKYNAGGIESALHDNRGRGRKAEITDSDITWVINKACQKPKDFGYSAELWYPASFTRFINSIAEQEGHPRMATVTETTLRKILANAKIRPFKVSYYCEKRDPDFDSKMHDVLVIYKQVSLQFDETGNLKPFEGVPVHTLSYDEKPGMTKYLIPQLRTGRPSRIPIKTAPYAGIMNMCAWARSPYWQQLTCLQGRPFHW